MKTCIDYSQGLPAAAGAGGLIPLLSLVLGEGQTDGDGDDDETNDATRGTCEQYNFNQDAPCNIKPPKGKSIQLQL